MPSWPTLVRAGLAFGRFGIKIVANSYFISNGRMQCRFLRPLQNIEFVSDSDEW